MKERQLQRARIVSSVAATIISLACGTNYVYSAWAPQFAERLKYSATESNLVGLAGNLGMYSLGIPVGMFVDRKGPRPAVLLGAILLGLGYFPLHSAYDSGAGAVALMCAFSYLTGFGGCMAFAAAVKTSALNWPDHRGTATAFPLAAFGLSAFFFSLVGGVLFPADTSAFLMLLAAGTFGLTLLGFFFLRVVPHTVADYQPLSTDDDASRQNKRLQSRTPSGQTLGESTAIHTPTPDLVAASAPDAGAKTGSDASYSANDDSVPTTAASTIVGGDAETSSLVSQGSQLPDDLYKDDNVDVDRSQIVDIRGWALVRNIEFWELFSIMGILSGIGLMTINNIGNDVNALWHHYDDSVSHEKLIARQQLHVSILSVASFTGRLLSGAGSDFLVKMLHLSRLWCLTIASIIFVIAQLCALFTVNPYLLPFVSGLSGLGYGLLFGVFPAIAVETFGIGGLSQNWGFLTLSPVLSGNLFNLFYGLVFDSHSVVSPDGERSCVEGLECYQAAYFVTLAACIVGFFLTLAVIRHQHVLRKREALKGVPD